MNFEEVLKLLKNEGDRSEYTYNQTEIRELRKYPEGSSFFLRKEELMWEVGYTNEERGKSSIEIVGTYSTKENGLRGFLLHRLQALCGGNQLRPAKKKTMIGELRGTDKLTIEVLIESMNELCIPISYYYTTENDRHAIRIREEDSGWISEYIDYKGNVLRKLNPMRLDRCVSSTFSRIIYLWYLDGIASKYFDVDKSYDYFTTEEIANYIV